MEIIWICFAALTILLLLGLPIGFAMGAVGVFGYASIVGWEAALNVSTEIIFKIAQSYEFSVIPLFILMGNMITRSRVSQDIYDASYAMIGHRRGGLAMATVMACAGFGAVCGSSVATAATMAKVAIPPMQKYGYKQTLAAGCVAAGGTLGILIPPSSALVLYGIITQNDITSLFMAGILPGLLGMFLYMGAVAYVVWRDPSAGPAGARSSWAERWSKIYKVWPVLVIFGLIMGGLYLGWFSATEGAGVGAFAGFLLALSRRTMSLKDFFDVLVESGLTTAMLMMILFGAFIFSNVINITGAPNIIVDWIKQLNVSALTVVIVIMLIYVVLGFVMEEISMILLTIPVFYPVVAQLGVNPIWFGILIVVVAEIATLSPPIGLNLFVLNALLPDFSLPTIYRGVMPFVVADVVRLAILIAFPIISLFLPQLMK